MPILTQLTSNGFVHAIEVAWDIGAGTGDALAADYFPDAAHGAGLAVHIGLTPQARLLETLELMVTMRQNAAAQQLHVAAGLTVITAPPAPFTPSTSTRWVDHADLTLAAGAGAPVSFYADLSPVLAALIAFIDRTGAATPPTAGAILTVAAQRVAAVAGTVIECEFIGRTHSQGAIVQPFTGLI